MRLPSVPTSTEHTNDVDRAEASQTSASQASARKTRPYSPPALTEFGTILELTQSGQAGLPEDQVAAGNPSI